MDAISEIYTKQAEDKGRNKLIRFLDQFNTKDIEGSKGMYNRVDLYATIDQKKWVFEVKDRTKLYNEMIMEKSKVMALFSEIKQKRANNAAYVITCGNQIYIWKMRTILTLAKENGWQYQYLPNTSEPNRSKYYSYKQVVYLPLTKADYQATI